ncbi:putative lipid II flippase FtsW [Thermomonas aquatica]|uniref:Probable peptidoglycan glycosyltransferase FtsW n=1 Tax=Thermomonas aquatica TaxID=2202149 RepID=A0A5B7ZQ33_9GAMM|nr:putative lipid II flippase FtsW [Thermomonas aquatica]QDA56869.1 putative lipid II flippase FtsW [Thermomonas aquatica]
MSAVAFDTPRQATRVDDIGGRFDPWLLGVSIALACFGVVMVGSAAVAGAGMDVGPWYFLNRHALFLAGGVVLAGIAMRTELKTIEQHSQLLLLLCVVLLLAVFLPGIGKTVNGARRWLNLGVSNFQAVEAVKVIYIVWLASYLKRYSEDVAVTWMAMLKPVGVVGALVVLLLLQPDFGSSVLLLGITICMLLLGGAPIRRIIPPILLLAPMLVLLVVLEPYRMRRVTSFMDPWQDQLGSGYQLSNALMAIGRGEWFGVGLGASVQKLNYLPEAHTDFIFSVISEELGFAGVCLVVGMYALLAGRAFWLGLKCVEMKRHFAGYIAFGIALWMSLQSFVSIGVNLGMLPTKGLTLPLVSSGGSSVLMTCAALGLLLRVSYEYERAARQVAKLRGVANGPSVGSAPQTSQPPMPADATARGTSRLRQRVEPNMGTSSESAALSALRRSR